MTTTEYFEPKEAEERGESTSTTQLPKYRYNDPIPWARFISNTFV
jgi:hypothetical protein